MTGMSYETASRLTLIFSGMMNETVRNYPFFAVKYLLIGQLFKGKHSLGNLRQKTWCFTVSIRQYSGRGSRVDASLPNGGSRELDDQCFHSLWDLHAILSARIELYSGQQHHHDVARKKRLVG